MLLSGTLPGSFPRDSNPCLTANVPNGIRRRQKTRRGTSENWLNITETKARGDEHGLMLDLVRPLLIGKV